MLLSSLSRKVAARTIDFRAPSMAFMAPELSFIWHPITPIKRRYGHCEYFDTPFVLKNAPQSFSSLYQWPYSRLSWSLRCRLIISSSMYSDSLEEYPSDSNSSFRNSCLPGYIPNSRNANSTCRKSVISMDAGILSNGMFLNRSTIFRCSLISMDILPSFFQWLAFGAGQRFVWSAETLATSRWIGMKG